LHNFEIRPSIQFLLNIYSVPKHVFKKFFELVENQQKNPLSVAFPKNKIKQLTGYKNLWRLRIGDYRLIYKQENHSFICLRIGRRDKVYDSLQFDSKTEKIINIAPNKTNLKEVNTKSLNTFQNSISDKNEYPTIPLPFKITLSKLKEWNISTKYHEDILGITTENDLDSIENKIPYEILSELIERIYPSENLAEKQARQEVQEKIKELFEFKCPIPRCSHVFRNSRGGWDSHVASLKQHPNWHPNIHDGIERKQLFKEEFSNWFHCKHTNKPLSTPLTITSIEKEYPCPIPNCSHIFKKTRGGWDSHAASLKTHPNWHPDEKNGSQRKKIFKDEYSSWFD